MKAALPLTLLTACAISSLHAQPAQLSVGKAVKDCDKPQKIETAKKPVEKSMVNASSVKKETLIPQSNMSRSIIAPSKPQPLNCNEYKHEKTALEQAKSIFG